MKEKTFLQKAKEHINKNDKTRGITSFVLSITFTYLAVIIGFLATKTQGLLLALAVTTCVLIGIAACVCFVFGLAKIIDYYDIDCYC